MMLGKRLSSYGCFLEENDVDLGFLGDGPNMTAAF